jgi:hypothetical protein
LKMNRHQKAILAESITVLAVTALAVMAMIIVKDWINRSEAMRAMKQLGQEVLEYRKTHGSVPPESYVESVIQTLQGHRRLGELHYRARWINFDSTPDQILAYSERAYRSPLVGSGYIVLRLDGRVQWMHKEQFERLLAQQQSQQETNGM